LLYECIICTRSLPLFLLYECIICTRYHLLSMDLVLPLILFIYTVYDIIFIHIHWISDCKAGSPVNPPYSNHVRWSKKVCYTLPHQCLLSLISKGFFFTVPHLLWNGA
jgi:hypothetical protein